ncbi:MAG TPA: polymer-forming cytoskeletal protein [Burkholderiales bacterium]|nr:polymer-forming cytoskeletal protein [Burkholderiales bacterium]
MLNRNGLFGTRDEKVEEKGKNPVAEAYAGSTSVRSSALQEPLNTNPGAMRGVRETSAAAAASAQAPVVTKSEDGPGSKLIVGPNIKLKGVEITDCDTLVVEGHVEATMDSRAIQIAQTGSFSGTVGIDIAEIRGSFSGELTVRKKLVIYSTGKVSGTVRYGKLVIEEGGELSGEIKTLSAGQEQPALASPKGASAPAQPAQPQAQPAVH